MIELFLSTIIVTVCCFIEFSIKYRQINRKRQKEGKHRKTRNRQTERRLKKEKKKKKEIEKEKRNRKRKKIEKEETEKEVAHFKFSRFKNLPHKYKRKSFFWKNNKI